MKELRERFFERLNNFKKNSSGASKELVNYRYGELYGLSRKMEIIKERYYERLNVFKRDSCYYDNNILNVRYGELYGLLDSMRILDLVSYYEFVQLIKELDSIYDNTL